MTAYRNKWRYQSKKGTAPQKAQKKAVLDSVSAVVHTDRSLCLHFLEAWDKRGSGRGI